MRRVYTPDSRWFESVLSHFLFSLFIKFSSFVHLLLFLNLFEEQTAVQNPLKNFRKCKNVCENVTLLKMTTSRIILIFNMHPGTF